MEAKLVVVGGDTKLTELDLKLPMIIGRGKGSRVRLQHPLVSRQHCELFEDQGLLKVRDLGSLNGTFVNNERITEAALPPGQLLTVGAVTFRAVYETQQVPALNGANKTLEIGPAVTSSFGITTGEPDEKTFAVSESPQASLPAVSPIASEATEELDANEEIEMVEDMFETDQLLPPEAGPVAAAPLAFPLPAAAYVPQPTPPAATPAPEEEDDDLNAFLKSLGK